MNGRPIQATYQSHHPNTPLRRSVTPRDDTGSDLLPFQISEEDSGTFPNFPGPLHNIKKDRRSVAAGCRDVYDLSDRFCNHLKFSDGFRDVFLWSIFQWASSNHLEAETA
jgi:hypothetical protein